MVNKIEKGRTVPKIFFMKNRTKDCFSTTKEASSSWDWWKDRICKNATYQEWNWIQGRWQAQLKGKHTRLRIHQIHEVKNSSSSPGAILNMRSSKVSRPLSMPLILMLMVLMFLICHIMILILLMCLWEISLKKLLPCMLNHITRDQRLVSGCPRALLLIWDEPTKLRDLRTKHKLVL
jgi:hypothetical protein